MEKKPQITFIGVVYGGKMVTKIIVLVCLELMAVHYAFFLDYYGKYKEQELIDISRVPLPFLRTKFNGRPSHISKQSYALQIINFFVTIAYIFICIIESFVDPTGTLRIVTYIAILVYTVVLSIIVMVLNFTVPRGMGFDARYIPVSKAKSYEAFVKQFKKEPLRYYQFKYKQYVIKVFKRQQHYVINLYGEKYKLIQSRTFETVEKLLSHKVIDNQTIEQLWDVLR